MNSSGIIVCSNNLYYRFWQGIKQLSPDACPIRNSPHYAFAREVIEKAVRAKFSPLPENSYYERYCQWERKCVGGNLGHSATNFYKKITKWTKQFDIQNNLPQVVQFDQDKYFIYDGLHRIVFMTALIDLSLAKDEIPVEIIIPKARIPAVEGIGLIEDHLNI